MKEPLGRGLEEAEQQAGQGNLTNLGEGTVSYAKPSQHKSFVADSSVRATGFRVPGTVGYIVHLYNAKH